MEAAGRAEKEFGAVIVIIKKTSVEFAELEDRPPCPSVMVNGKFIAKGNLVTYEELRDAIQGGGAPGTSGMTLASPA